VRIFGRNTRTHRAQGSHQIWVFHRRSEQLVGRDARRELEETLAHVLRPEASPEAALTVDKHRSSRLTVVRLRCRSPLIKVSINMFPTSLWFRRSKSYRKPITIAWENSNSSDRHAQSRRATASASRRRPRPELAASVVGSAPGDSCIGCGEPMAT
jgi:hypothetical protein